MPLFTVKNLEIIVIDTIGVRKGGAGGAAAPPNFLRIYLFGQKLSCHSGNDVLVTRRIY